jgi:hypothetical protein
MMVSQFSRRVVWGALALVIGAVYPAGVVA